jgi:4-hydroxybenzoate polyprenyltransferase
VANKETILMDAILQLYAGFRRVLFYIVRYRIHLSVVFAFLLYFNNRRSAVTVDYLLIASFALWHFSLFLFDRIYDRKIDAVSQPDEFIPESQAKVLYAFVAVLLSFSVALYVYAGYRSIYWFILLPVTFLYTVPVFNNIRAKNIFLIKNLYSAILIFGMPLIMQSMLLAKNAEAVIDYRAITSLMIYVLIGEIFWDIRDSSADKANNTHTLPNVLGLWPTKLILIGLIVADVLKSGFRVTESGVIYLILLSFTTEKTDRLVFHLPPLIALIRFCL